MQISEANIESKFVFKKKWKYMKITWENKFYCPKTVCSSLILLLFMRNLILWYCLLCALLARWNKQNTFGFLNYPHRKQAHSCLQTDKLNITRLWGAIAPKCGRPACVCECTGLFSMPIFSICRNQNNRHACAVKVSPMVKPNSGIGAAPIQTAKIWLNL